MQEGSEEFREAAKVRCAAPLSGENTQTTFSQRGSCDYTHYLPCREAKSVGLIHSDK